MQCDICHRSVTSRLPFNCTICARDTLYQPRLQLAQSLLQNESLSKEVEQNIAAPSTSSKKFKASTGSKGQSLSPAWFVERLEADQAVSEVKTRDIVGHVELLREEIKNMKQDISARKARLARRRSELASAKQELSKGRPTAVLEKSTTQTYHRWDTLQSMTAEARLFLCREAAQLYRLEQHRRRKGSAGRDVYSIGGVPIPDLRELNHASPVHVTASATNLAHLVHLISHYLSLKLPAEITLPHRDYPLPTMLTPTSSYSSRDLPFPGSTPPRSSHNSPSASRLLDQRNPPRPRVIRLEKKISALVKDDQIAHDSAVEALTLLAWDIAWLCKTQGVDLGGGSWEEVCSMGKNLWQLLFAPPSRTPKAGDESSKASLEKGSLSLAPTSKIHSPTTESPPSFGQFSHGTLHRYLGSAEGNEYMKAWGRQQVPTRIIQNPIRIIDNVKAMLLAERTGAEWELLDGDEWQEEESEGQVLAAEGHVTPQAVGVEETGVLVRNAGDGKENVEEGDGSGERADERGKGRNGYVKVKSR